MFFRFTKKAVLLYCLVTLLGPRAVIGQQSTRNAGHSNSDLSRYLDQANGMAADDAVKYALTHNGELEAARKEIDAAQALVKQARLRANPMLDVEGKRQVPPGRDNTLMAGVSLPLELNRRVPTRIAVAEREVEVRAKEFAN